MKLPLISITNVNFYYDYKTATESKALKDINLEIAQGEYVVFFGPSGCGKTTLVYLIGGIETDKNASTGKIIVDEHDVLQLDRNELAVFRQSGIGIIFQQFNLIPSLNVLDNVALPMTFVGVPQAKRREEAHTILKRLEMDAYALRFPSELSGGQQQRVGIARALANNPPIIIADEPLGNLDSENAELVLKFLKELQEKDGRTIIMVTHEAWSVRDADRIIYLKDGTVVKIGESILSHASTAAIGVSATGSLSPRLYRELYPNLTAEQVSVKSLSNLLLRGFSSDEIKRFEFFLGERLSNKIDAAAFERFLDLPYKEEGVGLWKQRAIKIAALTEDIIAEKKQLSDVFAELEKNPETPIIEEVQALRRWILKEYMGALDDAHTKRLDDAIAARLRETITAEDFRKNINLPFAKGGVGLPFRTMQHISDRLESSLQMGHMNTLPESMLDHLIK
jgi:putative ABC transport system ATP-binding protein